MGRVAAEQRLQYLKRTDRQLWFRNTSAGICWHAVRFYPATPTHKEPVISECGLLQRDMAYEWELDCLADQLPPEGEYICQLCRHSVLKHVPRPDRCRVLCHVTDTDMGEAG